MGEPVFTFAGSPDKGDFTVADHHGNKFRAVKQYIVHRGIDKYPVLVKVNPAPRKSLEKMHGCLICESFLAYLKYKGDFEEIAKAILIADKKCIPHRYWNLAESRRLPKAQHRAKEWIRNRFQGDFNIWPFK